MIDVLISIKPQYVNLIANGHKTVEVRKNRPSIKPPFKCYIYKTQSDKKVIGEFVCDRIKKEWEIADGLCDIVFSKTSCVPAKKLIEYANGRPLYAWHISRLKIYDTPKELSEFALADYTEVKSPPQSWFYVEKRE